MPRMSESAKESPRRRVPKNSALSLIHISIVVLWSEVWRLLKGLFSRRFNEEQAYVLKLVLSMIPIGIVGFLLKDRINDLLNAPYILAVVGAMLLVTAALLAFAYYAKPRQKETISYRDALIIGLAQACAAMPGLSRDVYKRQI